MNSNSEQLPAEFEAESLASLEEFIRELEEKEKDLNISKEMVIEVDELDIEDENVPNHLRDKLAGKTEDSENSPATNGKKSNVEAEEITKLKVQISELENTNGELVSALASQRKDFENHRRRTERERVENFRKQIGNLAEQLLPVLDNLDRALDTAKNLSEEKATESQQFFDGIVLINQQLNEILAEMGVEPIRSIGEEFNPEFHEAVATGESDEYPSNTISEEFLRGYKIGDQVIRAAMVKVVS